GLDSFTYRNTNGTATSNTATVTINVTPTAPPVANNDTYTTPHDTVFTINVPGVLANDISPTGRPLSTIDVTQPSHGTLVFNSDAPFTYTPAAGFTGVDSFTYRDSDGNNSSNVAAVVINVTPGGTGGGGGGTTGGGIGPQVISVVRLGFHSQPTELVLTFDT